MSTSPAPRWRAVPRIAEAAVERARLEVAPRVRSRAPRVPFVVLVSLVLLGGIVGLLLFNTSMQQAAFTGSELEERAAVLSAKEETLTREVEELRDPQRLAMAATEQGMVPAILPAIIDLSEGRIVVEGRPASADDALSIAPPAPIKPAELSPSPIYHDVYPEPAAPTAPADPAAPADQGVVTDPAAPADQGVVTDPAAPADPAAPGQDLPTTDDPAQP